MYRLLIATFILLTALTACSNNDVQHQFVVTTPHDRLFTRLDTLRSHGTIFGQEFDPLNINIALRKKGKKGKTIVSTDYPAMLQFELGGIELGQDENIDGIPFSRIQQEVIDHHKLGGIVAFTWHPHNPCTGGDAWDVSNPSTVKNILPGGPQHEVFMQWLQRLVVFLRKMQTKERRTIPYVMQPWEGYNDNMVWWGEDCCTEQEFVALWTLMQDYLKNRLHTNPIWCFSSDVRGNWSEHSFASRYPGNDRVDILACHIEQRTHSPRVSEWLPEDIAYLQAFASLNRKMLALTDNRPLEQDSSYHQTTELQRQIDQFPICFVVTKGTHPDALDEDVINKFIKDIPGDAATGSTVPASVRRSLLFLEEALPRFNDTAGRDSWEMFML